ncbi:hypothetical protein DH09_18190 [Bacillaceae bacterium JMAK1]|nr:hypothetical protein DH09_18190 [Bacillaceae bacterium JMAK1]
MVSLKEEDCYVSFFLLMEEMVMLYIMLAIGFMAVRFNLIPLSSKTVLTRLLLYLTLPALIISSMHIPFQYERALAFIVLMLLSFSFLSFTLLYGKVITRKLTVPSTQSGVFQNLLLFGNQGFIGVSVVFLLFGHEGLFYAVAFNLLYFILIWTYGIAVMKTRPPKLYLNPGLLATSIGVILFLLPIRLPDLMMVPINTIGQMTIPLSMILIGILLSESTFHGLRKLLTLPLTWFVMAHRLFLLPLIVFVPFLFLPIPFEWLAIAVILSATPCAPTVSFYSEQYGGDTAFASVSVILSTFLAMFSLPLLYSLFSTISAMTGLIL